MTQESLALSSTAKYAAHYYNLGRSSRLVYQVVNDEMVILLLDVGDHKEVYGKD
jgi:mRNA-degrading endonuclease YafQ of YafQ-DinJ toxin-antitoxin module